MSDPISVPLHSKRRTRAGLAQHLQHAVPAFGLAMSGLRALSAGAHGFELGLAIAEVMTSTALVVAIARHLRHRHGAPHIAGFDWITSIAAAMLFTEAGEKWQRSGRLFTPESLTAVATVITAVANTVATKRGGRHRLRVSSEGVAITRPRLRRQFSAAWNDITAIEIGDREAVIRTRTGSTGRINLADLHNATDVASALRGAQARLHAATSE